MDLSMMYMIRDVLVIVKKEMVEKGWTFDELLEHYDEGLRQMEKDNV